MRGAKDSSRRESQLRATFQCLTSSLPTLSISFFSGRASQSSGGSTGKAAETGGWGVSAVSSGRKRVQIPPVHPKPSFSSSASLCNFQNPFINCWRFFLSSVAAVYKGRKNTQLEYTKIPLGINRNFCLYIHIGCSWHYNRLK